MPDAFQASDEDLPLVQKAQADDLDAFDDPVIKYQSQVICRDS